MGKIAFDYLPGSLTDHGWTLAIENEENGGPLFSCPVDSPPESAVRVTSQGRYYLQYPLAGSSGDILLNSKAPGESGYLFSIGLRLPGAMLEPI